MTSTIRWRMSVPNSGSPKPTSGRSSGARFSASAQLWMLKKKAPRKGLSDYQSEFCINVPTRIVLSGSVGSGDSNSKFFIRDNREDEAAIAQLKFQEVVHPVGSFAPSIRRRIFIKASSGVIKKHSLRLRDCEARRRKVRLLRSTCWQLLDLRKEDACGWLPQRVQALAWLHALPPRLLAHGTPPPSADPQRLRYAIGPASRL